MCPFPALTSPHQCHPCDLHHSHSVTHRVMILQKSTGSVSCVDLAATLALVKQEGNSGFEDMGMDKACCNYCAV